MRIGERGRAAFGFLISCASACAQFAHCLGNDTGPSKSTITFHDGSIGLNQSYLRSPLQPSPSVLPVFPSDRGINRDARNAKSNDIVKVARESSCKRPRTHD